MSFLINLIVIVSHDSGFLNNTITDVLHINRFKVKRYRGNLESFVKAVPEAKSYYTLEAAEDYRFKLPDPPLLEGVKTKEKSLLKMCVIFLSGIVRYVLIRYPQAQGWLPVPRNPCPAAQRHHSPSLALVSCRCPRSQRFRKINSRQAPRRRH